MARTMLLEQAGADRALRLGAPEVWRDAVRALEPCLIVAMVAGGLLMSLYALLDMMLG